MTGVACRRCGRVSEDQTLIYGPDPHGGLTVKAAQCRKPCGQPEFPGLVQEAAALPGAGREASDGVITARKPGRCSACPRDIIPGDQIVFVGEGQFAHLECAPRPTPPAASRQGRLRRR